MKKRPDSPSKGKGGEQEKAGDMVQEKVNQAGRWIEQKAGGPARLRVILVLAAVLSLDTADKATLSAMAEGLKKDFGIGNTDIGVLVSVVSLVGALATLPFGILVDRTKRTRLLAASIALWTVAIVLCGTATSFSYLLTTRVFLGILTAVSIPAVASLTGDFFPAGERARIYGMILAGEFVGTGIGFIFAGEISSLLNWRWGFFSLGIPSLVLAWIVWRRFPEPARGGQGWLQPGQKEIPSAEDARRGKKQSEKGEDTTKLRSELSHKIVREARIEPDRNLVLHKDPRQMHIWEVVRYVLKIRTNLLLIISSALGYFFFAGVRAFAMLFVTGHYGIPRSLASPLIVVPGLGAIAGVMGGGRLADALLARGWVQARILVPGVGLFLSVIFFAPAIWTTHLGVALLFLTLAAASLGGTNPPLDAARLDIMHPILWGRAESVRTTMRMLLEAAAPTIFGFISQHVFGGESGLMYTYLLMLIPLLAASSLAIPAWHTYPRDVATAAESVRETSGKNRSSS